VGQLRGGGLRDVLAAHRDHDAGPPDALVGRAGGRRDVTEEVVAGHVLAVGQGHRPQLLVGGHRPHARAHPRGVQQREHARLGVGRGGGAPLAARLAGAQLRLGHAHVEGDVHQHHRPGGAVAHQLDPIDAGAGQRQRRVDLARGEPALADRAVDSGEEHARVVEAPTHLAAQAQRLSR
jgi:hypothetical protein